MNRLLKAMMMGTLTFAMQGSLHASETACSVQDRSDSVVLMYCPNQLGEKAWVEAAKAACMNNQQCNVWIWSDRNKMPKAAPKTDADMDKKHTSAAIAIWISDSQSMMKLKKVR
jgi:uncharacterized protein YaeQ